MNSFFEAFEKSSLNDWKDQIIKDLKGKEHSILEFEDSIEEINYKAYYHQDEASFDSGTPGLLPYTRGYKTDSSKWSNAAPILINDEKAANEEALDLLMKGANMLFFKPNKDNCDWKSVLNNIQLEHIDSQFVINSLEDYNAIKAIAPKAVMCYDHFASQNAELFNAIVEDNKSEQTLSLEVNGFAVQRSGATTWQEIAFCLNVGHEYLLELMNAGLTVDQAAKMIHFHLGVGSNYFNEIAKFRAMRLLWSEVLGAYGPTNESSHDCYIVAVIGHTNKSLRDPYTNLLRQTTEAMSAVNGANAVMILPYDFHSKSGSSELAKRMALNISLILQEESYLDKVIDPAGGSYSVEYLTNTIATKSWRAFQEIESNGGLYNENALNQFKDAVDKKQTDRIQAFQEGKIVGIGMNKYPDPNEVSAEWNEIPSYLGMKPMILDLETKNIEA